jgi:hypothetical protein
MSTVRWVCLSAPKAKPRSQDDDCNADDGEAPARVEEDGKGAAEGQTKDPWNNRRGSYDAFRYSGTYPWPDMRGAKEHDPPPPQPTRTKTRLAVQHDVLL